MDSAKIFIISAQIIPFLYRVKPYVAMPDSQRHATAAQGCHEMMKTLNFSVIFTQKSGPEKLSFPARRTNVLT